MKIVFVAIAAPVISQVAILFITDTDMMVQKTKKAWNAIQDFFKNLNK